jgi:fatty acid desaturase
MQNLTKNALSGIFAIIAIAIICAIVIGVLWLIPIILVVLGGVGLFFVFRVLLEDTEEGGG